MLLNSHRKWPGAICCGLVFILVLTACAAPTVPATPSATAISQVAGITRTVPSGVTTTAAPRASVDAGSVAANFDEQRAFGHVQKLAQPEFMGRHVGTPGELLGAQYLSDQFQSYGLMPAGQNGSYIQEFPMDATEFTAVPELTLIDAAGQERALQLRDDFRPLIGGLAGPGAAEGPGIFAGFGDFSGVDAKGKIALVIPRGSFRNVINNARNAGVVALIVPTGEQPIVKGESQEPASPSFPVFLVSQNGASALLEGSGHSREDLNASLRSGQAPAPFPLAFSIRLNAEIETRPIVARNVLGLLPAASATEDNCVVGAHYEEIGPDPDGVVYPAANDNASGTAVMLEVAQLVASQVGALRYNVVFVGWSGHEEGLLGSDYYLNNPVFPVSRTKCYINMDTVGNGSGGELAAGISKESLRDVVQKAVDRITGSTGNQPAVQIASDTSPDSDHFNFIQKGVPAFNLNWTGVLDDHGNGGKIHIPEDTADNVDPAKLKVTGQVATAILLDLAGEAQ